MLSPSLNFACGIDPGCGNYQRTGVLNIPGLISWLRSDSLITLNGSTVSAWGDISNNKNNVSQGTSAQQPVYIQQGGVNNLPYLLCGQNSIYSELDFPTSCFTSLSAAEAFTIFSRDQIPTPPANGSDGGLWKFGTSGTATHCPENNNGIYDDFGSNTRYTCGTYPTPTVFLNPTIYNASSATNSWRNAINGKEFFSSGTNTVAFRSTAQLLNWFYSTFNVYITGKFYEFMMFNRVLTIIERSIVTSYLKKRYNIT